MIARRMYFLCEVVLQFAGRDLLQSANTNNGKNNDKNDGKNDGKGQRKCSGTTYTIKSGDTLSKLASKALEIEEKCSIEKIAKANPTLKNVNVILAGAKLCLPLGCKQPTQEVSCIYV